MSYSSPPSAVRRWGMLVNSLIVMTGFILSRVLGLVRESVISSKFGTQDVADIYNAAFYIPDLLYTVVIGGALGSAFIPIFSELLNREGQARAWRLASQVMNVALIVLSLLSLAILLAAPLLTALVYPDYDPAKRAEIASLLRLFLLSPLLLGLGGLAMAVLNALDRYTLPALAPSVYNLGIIGGAIFLEPRWGVYGVAWGVVIGALLYLLIQLPGLISAGMRYSLSLGLGESALRRIGKLMGPRVLGQSAMHLNILVMMGMASSLGEGRLRALSQGYQLMLLPHGIFALSLATVAFPAMSRAYAAGDLNELGRSMRSVLRVVLWTVLPSALLLALLATPIVRLLFQRGAFDDDSTRLVVGALWFYASALPAFAASEILIRSFYAMQDTRTPVLIGVVTVALNIPLSWLLVYQLGFDHRALAGAFSLANNLEALLLTILLRRRLGRLDHQAELRGALRRTLLSAIGMGAAMLLLVVLSSSLLPWVSADGQGYLAGDNFLALLGWLALALALAAGVYTGLSALQGSPELKTVFDRLAGKLRRSRSA